MNSFETFLIYFSFQLETVAGCLLLVASCLRSSPITNHQSPITNYLLSSQLSINRWFDCTTRQQDLKISVSFISDL